MEQLTSLENLYHGCGSGLCTRFRKNLGVLLVKERKKRNLTLDELCAKLSIKIEVASDLERGQNQTNWAVLCRMLDFYNKWLTVQLDDMEYPQH